MEHPFIVCKASAGAGKTFTLVKEYLKMVFSEGEGHLHEGFRSVLAITFTNKAAAEMKSRIMEELDVMGRAPIDPASGGMGAALLREMPRLAPADLSRMARSLHATILHHYTDLSVCTIDSFMHRVVRTFAHDLGLPVNFDVAIDRQKLIDDAVASLMSLVGTEGQQQLTDVLQAFAISRMENDKGFNVEPLIADLAAQLFAEDIDEHLTPLRSLSLADFDRLHKAYTAEVRAFEQSVCGAAADILNTLHRAGLDAESCAYGNSGFYSYLCRLRDGQIAEPNPRTISAFSQQKFTSAKASRELQAAAASIAPTITARYDAMVATIASSLTRYNTCLALLRNLYSMALLSVLDEQLRQAASDNEVLHLSDFNKLINRVVDDDNPAPFIYERLGNRYRHFLIDEFQDTSIKQWHNLVPLLENGVSQGAESLVVGDGKQAIYRFRQGDVRQFVDLPQVHGMKGTHGQTLSHPSNSAMQFLGTNFRSASALIEFNNSLFSWLARGVYGGDVPQNPLVQQLYVGTDAHGQPRPEGDEELRQAVHSSVRGYVRLSFVSKHDADAADGQREAIFARMQHTIEMLVAERGYSYSDIRILARGNADLAQISDYLSQHSSIPQTSSESFYLRSSHAVMAIVAVMRLVHNRADSVAQADLDFRLRCLGIEAEPDLDRLGSLSIYDLCEATIRQLHLDGFDTPYVASLLSRVAAFSARHKQDVGQFLEWFDDQPTLSASAAEGVDAVELQTIHKSKGLEAPVVLCPLFWGREHTADIWVHTDDRHLGLPTAYVSLGSSAITEFEPQRQAERTLVEVDDLNVLYVALTRPREQLYIFCPDPADLKSAKERDLRYPSLLRAFATAPDGGSRLGMSQAEGSTFVYGDPTAHKGSSRRKEGKTPIALSRLSFLPWERKVRVASPAEKAVLSILDDRKRYGTLAHELLSAVACEADIDAAAAALAERYSLAEVELRTLRDMALRVVRHPEAAPFFDPSSSVRNECEIVVDGHCRRPDRVVMAEGRTLVVDFKSGVPLDKHRTQVLDYCRAMQSMGLPAVSGYLLYLDPTVRVEQVC